MNKQYLQEIATDVKKKLPDNHGFILLTFPFDGGGNNRITYTSNGQRADCIKTLKEFLFMIGEGENWMKHLK